MPNAIIQDFIVKQLSLHKGNKKPRQTAALIMRQAVTHHIDPLLLLGMIWVESRYDPMAKSPVGARGLMQLMIPTAMEQAKKLGLKITEDEIYDPIINVTLGTEYLASLIKRYDGDYSKALTAYNRGMGNVAKILAKYGALPPSVLEVYSSKVLTKYYEYAALHEEIPTQDRMMA